MPVGPRLDAVIARKSFSDKYQVLFYYLIYVKSVRSNAFAHMKTGVVANKRCYLLFLFDSKVQFLTFWILSQDAFVDSV